MCTFCPTLSLPHSLSVSLSLICSLSPFLSLSSFPSSLHISPLTQLGNGGEVTKYLQQVEESALSSPQVQFALKVWGALKTDDYAKFFKYVCSDVCSDALLHVEVVDSSAVMAWPGMGSRKNGIDSCSHSRYSVLCIVMLSYAMR